MENEDFKRGANENSRVDQKCIFQTVLLLSVVLFHLKYVDFVISAMLKTTCIYYFLVFVNNDSNID